MSTVVSRLHEAVEKPAPALLTTRVILDLADARTLLDEIARLCDEHGACQCGTIHCPTHQIGDAVPCVLGEDIHCTHCVGDCAGCRAELEEQRATYAAIETRRAGR